MKRIQVPEPLQAACTDDKHIWLGTTPNDAPAQARCLCGKHELGAYHGITTIINPDPFGNEAVQ